MTGALQSKFSKGGLIFATALLPTLAEASQGPGVAAGTASPWLQLAMAIAVYGGAALMIAAGIIGAVRQTH